MRFMLRVEIEDRTAEYAVVSVGAPGTEPAPRTLPEGIIAIGGKAVTLPEPVVEDGRIRWLQVVDGVDLELRLTPTGAQWLRHIHHADAPHSFTWTVQRQEAFDGDRIVEQGAGEDAGREKAGVTLRRSEARAINGWVKWETEETFDRRVSRILDRKTRRRGWSDEVQYPVVLHG